MIVPNNSVSSGDVARHYDELDVFYRELWGDHVHHGLWLTGDESPEQAVRQLVERVAKKAEIRPGSRVCDVGCGYGATARMLAAEHQAHVTGITISPHQHRYARAQVQSAGPPPTYELADWASCSLPASSFDAVLFVESLAHMNDKRAALAEAHRVLRPGGQLVACTWLGAVDAPAWARRLLLEPICREGRLPGLPSMAEYRQWIARAGFTTPEVEDRSDQVRRTWSIIIARVVRAVVRRAEYRRYLLNRLQQNRRFALTLLRLWIGYRTGAVRYGLYTARKPS